MSDQEWQVARLDAIAEPGALEFCVGDTDWPFRGFVVRWNGKVYAYANSCPHAGHPLNLSPDGFFDAEKNLLLCSSHGAVFTPDSGACVGGPCSGAKLNALKCTVRNESVFVRAPASERSD